MNKNIFHILVVDDDDRIRDLVRQYLEENNFLVSTAIDASEAKNKIEIFKFDLLILDIMMPGQSGLSLTKEIKSKNSNQPIILLTDLISVTSNAAIQIKKILSDAPEGIDSVVVGVDKSGCSGYSYKLDFAKQLSYGVTLAGIVQFIFLIFFTKKYYKPSLEFRINLGCLHCLRVLELIHDFGINLRFSN